MIFPRDGIILTSSVVVDNIHRIAMAAFSILQVRLITIARYGVFARMTRILLLKMLLLNWMISCQFRTMDMSSVLVILAPQLPLKGGNVGGGEERDMG